MAEINKRYLIKVFNLDWTFKNNIPEDIVTTSITYSENINGGQGMLKVGLNRNFNDTSIEKSDFIKVFLFDSNSQNWRLIYTWIVETIRRTYTPNINTVELTARGLWSLLTRLFFEKASSKTFSENKDPWDIIKDVITYFNSVYTWSWLSDTGVTLLWSNISIDFDFTSCLESIENLAESAGFYFLVKEDWNVIFQVKKLTVTHKFTAWEDLQELVIDEDTRDLQNKIFLDFSTWQASDEDVTSQNTFWKRELLESRTDINLQATADITATNILADKKDPKQKVSLKINQKFILENIKPWDNIRVNNLDYSINNIQIQKIIYTPELVTIQLEEFDSLGKILNK